MAAEGWNALVTRHMICPTVRNIERIVCIGHPEMERHVLSEPWLVERVHVVCGRSYP